MSKKSAKIAAIIESCRGADLEAHYLAFFECFNQGAFYESHDVLEELWLGVRAEPKGLFYKALIQLAGAFVHLQKNRLQPAASLLKLSRSNLEKYSAVYERLDVARVIRLIGEWLELVGEAGATGVNPLRPESRPTLSLLPPD